MSVAPDLVLGIWEVHSTVPVLEGEKDLQRRTEGLRGPSTLPGTLVIRVVPAVMRP